VLTNQKRENKDVGILNSGMTKHRAPSGVNSILQGAV
jgi:hypothetical protein